MKLMQTKQNKAEATLKQAKAKCRKTINYKSNELFDARKRIGHEIGNGT